MIRQVSSTPSWRVKRVESPRMAAEQQHLVGRRPLAALVGELHVEVDLLGLGRMAALGLDEQPHAGGRVELDHELHRLGLARAHAAWKPTRGGRSKTRRSSVCVTGMRLPVRMKIGTPDQRQLSMSRRSAA